MKNKIFLTISFLILLGQSFSSCSVKTVLSTQTYVYNYEKFVYPESVYLKNKKNIGIAFSGGGNRAASLTTGQLRALNTLGLLDSIKYISAVSGGAWASVCYTYSQVNDEELLGKYIKSDSLKMSDIDSTKNGILLKSICNSKVWHRYANSTFKLHGDETYSNILNDIYLKPLSISGSMFPSYNQKVVDEIVNRNPILSPNNFYLTNQNSNRPFLIVNGTVVGEVGRTTDLPAVHFEMTPLYSGATYFNRGAKHNIGGGYIETFAIDYKYKESDANYSYVESRNIKNRKFSLSDIMAITSNAPGSAIYKTFILRSIGLPEIDLWSPRKKESNSDKENVRTKEFAMADGGNLENLGLIPLLKRKVDKIIVFVNCKTPITKEGENIYVDDAIDAVFGVKLNSVFSSVSTGILNNDKNQFEKLKDTLYKLKNKGEPVIYTDNYNVNKNSDLGIFTNEEWKSVEITWVYNENFDALYANEKLDDEIREYYYGKGLDCLDTKFPHLPTIKTSEWFRAIEYDPIWANMLANFSSWVIMDNKETFESIINK